MSCQDCITVSQESPYESDVVLPQETDWVYQVRLKTTATTYTPYNVDNAEITMRILDDKFTGADDALYEFLNARFSKDQSSQATNAGVGYNDVASIVLQHDAEIGNLTKGRWYYWHVVVRDVTQDIQLLFRRGRLKITEN